MGYYATKSNDEFTFYIINDEGKKIKLGHKSKTVHRDYTDFSGSNVSPLTREQYKKAMKRYLEIKIHE